MGVGGAPPGNGGGFVVDGGIVGVLAGNASGNAASSASFISCSSFFLRCTSTCALRKCAIMSSTPPTIVPAKPPIIPRNCVAISSILSISLFTSSSPYFALYAASVCARLRSASRRRFAASFGSKTNSAYGTVAGFGGGGGLPLELVGGGWLLVGGGGGG